MSLGTTKKIAVIYTFLNYSIFCGFVCFCLLTVLVSVFFLSAHSPFSVTIALILVSLWSLKLSQINCKSKEVHAELFYSFSPQDTKCRFKIANTLE